MPEPLITQKMSSVIPATCCTSESTLPSALIYTTLHAKVSSDAAGQSSWRLSAGCLLNQSCQINSNQIPALGFCVETDSQTKGTLLDARPFDYLLPYAGINRMSCVLEMDITRISSSRAPSLTSCASRLRSCIVSTSPKYVLAVGGHLLQFL